MLPITLLALSATPAGLAWGQALDITAEIASLRTRLAAHSAQEQRCLAGSTQPMLTASLAGDLKALQARANQAAAEGTGAEAQRWRELARKAEELEARAASNARSGADLFQSQQVGLECLDRFAAEREALRASLEVAVADPGAYGESLHEARQNGTARLRQDLTRLRERGRALSAEWKRTRVEARAGAQALKAEVADLRRRNTAALESEPARGMADPTLRAAESLVAAAAAWEREQAAAGRVDAARDDLERRQAASDREDAARQARDYWAAADRLLGRETLTGSP
jgi:hypothetical protein